MENLSPWIEHLDKPLVLAGFVLVVLAGLVKLFKPEKLNSRATERLMNRGMILAFLLGFLIILFAFAESLLKAQGETTAASKPTVKQSISHSEGVQGQAVRDLNINTGTGTLTQQLGRQAAPTTPPADLEQDIRGSKGVQGQAGRDTNIQTQGN